jgi:hypothetical protein
MVFGGFWGVRFSDSPRLSAQASLEKMTLEDLRQECRRPQNRPFGGPLGPWESLGSLAQDFSEFLGCFERNMGWLGYTSGTSINEL